MTSESKLNHCSFCGNHKDKVTKLIVSEDVAICSDCIELCTQLMIDENNNKSVIRKRFFVIKTGYYPNGVKANATNKKSMSVFKSVYKQYEMYFNTPIFTPADMFEVKKTLITIKKLVANSY